MSTNPNRLITVASPPAGCGERHWRIDGNRTDEAEDCLDYQEVMAPGAVVAVCADLRSHPGVRRQPHRAHSHLLGRLPARPLAEARVILRYQRLPRSRLDLLHRPRVAVWVVKGEEGAAVGLGYYQGLAHLHAAIEKLLPRGTRI